MKRITERAIEEQDFPTTGEGDPDYEAAVEQLGLEHDRVFEYAERAAGAYDRYRCWCRRGGCAIVCPQTRYTDLAEDALRIEALWAAYRAGELDVFDGTERAHRSDGADRAGRADVTDEADGTDGDEEPTEKSTTRNNEQR